MMVMHFLYLLCCVSVFGSVSKYTCLCELIELYNDFIKKGGLFRYAIEQCFIMFCID